jgi:hypothetical protein
MFAKSIGPRTAALRYQHREALSSAPTDTVPLDHGQLTDAASSLRLRVEKLTAGRAVKRRASASYDPETIPAIAACR